MEKFDFENILLTFVTECLLRTILKLWWLFIVLPLAIGSLAHLKIKQIPKRYPIQIVIKSGYLKVRQFKSLVFEKKNEEKEIGLYDDSLGMSKEDLKILLETKFMNHRSRNRSMFDKGPFITKVEFPGESNLLVVTAESQDVEKGKSELLNVVKYLNNHFDKQIERTISQIERRELAIELDLRKIRKSLKNLSKIENEFGYTPILAQQKKDYQKQESLLKYMLIDINSYLDPNNIKKFVVETQKVGVYPITKRKGVYYFAAAVVGGVLSIALIFIFAIKHYFSLPPAIPAHILEEQRCAS